MNHMTICVGGGHALGDRSDFWLVYMSTALFLIPAVIEVILWLGLQRATRRTSVPNTPTMTPVPSRKRYPFIMPNQKNIVNDMQVGLARSAMVDTFGYIICWGPFNVT